MNRQKKNMRVKLPFSILMLSAIFFLSFNTVKACSCNPSKPPCGSIKNTSVIFTGEVINITVVAQRRKKVQFKVTESLHNVKAQNLIVGTGLGGGDCGYDFKVGGKYLVYGNEYEGGIGTGLCSRTQLLSSAQNDLEILRQIKSNKAVSSRLFGRLNLLQIEGHRVNFLSKIKIIAENEASKIYETVSDELGSYRFVSLPDGKYKIKATYKDSFTKEAETSIKSAKGEQCAELNFYFYEGGSIKGRVIDNEGKAVAGLRVYAERLVFSPEDAKGSGLYNSRTDENGNYEIEGLQKGKYILGINYKSTIDIDFPFPATYYPQGKTKEQAENIVVTTEKSLEGFNFRLPPKLKLRTVTGIALFTDGGPIADGRVEVREERTNFRMDNADIDKEGRFTLRVVEDQSYYLYVYKASNMRRESKKIYLPKTGEIEPLKVIVHPLQ